MHALELSRLGPAKEGARGMSNLAEHYWQSLRRATRDLVTAPRTWSWKWQRWPLKVIGFSDMDWVGRSVTRRSAGCKIFKRGSRTLLTSSTTQTWIALSSGEAEFCGTLDAASSLMGVGDLLAEVDFGVNLEFVTNHGEESPSGDRTVWNQKEWQGKVFAAGHVPGSLNPEGLGVKFLTEAGIGKALERHGLVQCGLARRAHTLSHGWLNGLAQRHCATRFSLRCGYAAGADRPKPDGLSDSQRVEGSVVAEGAGQNMHAP